MLISSFVLISFCEKVHCIKRVSENLEELGKTLKKAYKSGDNFRLVLFLMVWLPQIDNMC